MIGTWKFSLQAMAGGLLRSCIGRGVVNRPRVQGGQRPHGRPNAPPDRCAWRTPGATVLVDRKERRRTPAALKLYEIGKAAGMCA